MIMNLGFISKQLCRKNDLLLCDIKYLIYSDPALH
jgi:hypothetical protein